MDSLVLDLKVLDQMVFVDNIDAKVFNLTVLASCQQLLESNRKILLKGSLNLFSDTIMLSLESALDHKTRSQSHRHTIHV